MRETKIVLIVILSAMIVGLVSFMVWVMSFEDWSWQFGRGKEMKLYLTESIAADQIQNLLVDVAEYDVHILPTEASMGEEIIVEAYYTHKLKDSQKIKIDVKDQKLRVLRQQETRNGIFFGSYFGEVRIYLPENVVAKIKEWKINTISGDISWEDSIRPEAAEKILLESTSGDMKIGMLKANSIYFKTVSGDMKAKEVSGQVQIETISGDLKIEKLLGHGNIATTSGDIKLKLEEMSDAVDIETMSGSVAVEMNKQIEVAIHTKTVSGDVNIDSDSIRTGQSLTIETVSGDIEVVSH